jgi:hypothetical protein
MENAIGIYGWVVGFISGMALFIFLTNDNPTLQGSWHCTDWQIVNYKPECHAMTKQEATK